MVVWLLVQFNFLYCYCKLVMTSRLWFWAITAIYFSSLGWHQLCLASLIHSILLSLPRQNMTDCFIITDRDRETICWVYLFDTAPAALKMTDDSQVVKSNLKIIISLLDTFLRLDRILGVKSVTPRLFETSLRLLVHNRPNFNLLFLPHPLTMSQYRLWSRTGCQNRINEKTIERLKTLLFFFTTKYCNFHHHITLFTKRKTKFLSVWKVMLCLLMENPVFVFVNFSFESQLTSSYHQRHFKQVFKRPGYTFVLSTYPPPTSKFSEPNLQKGKKNFT